MMRNKLLLALLAIGPFLAFGQKQPRQILNGKVTADSLRVENLSVLNVTSNIGAVTDEEGAFTIYARPGDTLFFSGISFRSAQLVLKEQDFYEKRLIVKLDVNVTVLDEVVIKANTLTGTLENVSKNTKTLQISSQFDSYTAIITGDPQPTTDVNTALPAQGSSLQGVNFVKIYDMIFKRRQKKDRGEIYDAGSDRSFTKIVKQRYTHHFITETLNIPHSEIGLFLAFCDGGKDTAWMLDQKNEFELTDYLVSKSREYLKSKK